MSETPRKPLRPPALERVLSEERQGSLTLTPTLALALTLTLTLTLTLPLTRSARARAVPPSSDGCTAAHADLTLALASPKP